MFEKIKAWLSMIAAAVGVLTIIGTIAYQAGWVVKRADAESMISLSKTEITTLLAQAVAQEEKARRDADLEFQLDLAVQRLQFLLSVEDRNEAQEAEIEQVKRKIERIEAKLEGAA